MGIDVAQLDQLRERVRREVDQGILPSCQFAIGLDGELITHEVVGDARLDSTYLVFSCTKGFVAGVVWQLMGEGRLSPSDRIVDHLPEIAAHDKGDITVEQLLTHTSGFPRAPLGPPTWTKPVRRVEAMAGWRLNWEPGSQFEYHPTSAHWVLGEIVARIDGRTIGDAIAARISEPLGLGFRLGIPVDEQANFAHLVLTGTDPSPDDLEQVFGVRTYERGEVTPEALVELGRPENLAVGVPGGGGVGTAADLALYYQALLTNPGGLWDDALLRDATRTIRCTMPDPLLGHAANRSLGLIVAGDDGKSHLRGMGHTVSPTAFGHNGAAGQIAWADPETGLSFGYVTNGVDRDFLREARRTSGIASRAGGLATRN
ncbi:MAG TPA: serine hydrolase domain-containing protein [Microthrixaceae bacterium]|nr:serine hydrolase domain-containing protein [Microthrixaceae bacterium]